MENFEHVNLPDSNLTSRGAWNSISFYRRLKRTATVESLMERLAREDW